jgi:hypothetical protein
MICDIDDAIQDRRLLGAALGNLKSWGNWLVILKAAFGLPLNPDELVIFKDLAGGRDAPTERVAELWVVSGRRGGKTRMAATISSYLAAFADNTGALAVGEVGHVLCLAPSKDQARLVHDYAAGHFHSSPILQQEIESESASEIRLKGNIVLGVHSNSFRTIRGRTLLACCFDEVAYWRDEASASPDLEVYRAVLPSLATTGGMLVGISSPYRKLGLLHAKHRDHFGVNGDVLVIQAPTERLNPTIDKRVIARARDSDPAAALSEWDAEFRTDLSSYLSDSDIDAAVDRDRPTELPPRVHLHRYHAFTDASAGRRDSFTLAIGHAEGSRTIIDLVRGVKPPFDPQTVAHDFAKVARTYGCQEVSGDNFSGEWVAAAFREAGVGYRRSDLNRSALYLEMLPKFTQGRISIPNHPQLLRELRLLERRTSRSSRDQVDHPANGSDDWSNSIAGCSQCCTRSVRKTAKAQVGRATYVPQKPRIRRTV